MQFYIAIDGKEEGPFNTYRVTEMLRDEAVTRDSLGWQQGQEKWLPLREIPALESVIEGLEREKEAAEPKRGGLPEPKAAEERAPHGGSAAPSPSAVADAPRKTVVDPQVRPFVRFWARTFDYTLVWMLVWTFFEMPKFPEGVSIWEVIRNQDQYFSQEEMFAAAIIQLIAFTGWHLLEGLLIHLFGTTPGKAIFGIRVTQASGSPVGLWAGWGRSFYVWIAGFGLGIFPFTIIGMTLALLRLLSTGMTIWDRQLQLQVRHAPIGPGRILLAVAVFFLLVALRSITVS